MGKENLTIKIKHKLFRNISIISVFIVILFICCSRFWGTYKLGNNLYMWDGDCKEDRIIVFNNKVSNDIFGITRGANVIPPYDQWINPPIGYYREYVETASHNEKWIIVKSYLKSYSEKESKINYWIIDKNFNPNTITAEKIVALYLIGPMDSSAFIQQLKEKNIKLSFSKKYDAWR